MTDAEKSPGQVAYEADLRGPGYEYRGQKPWYKLNYLQKREWEAGAAAVRAPLLATIQQQAERIKELEATAEAALSELERSGCDTGIGGPLSDLRVVLTERK